MSIHSDLAATVAERGYVFAAGEDVRRLIGESGENWPAFAAHWDNLGEDQYLQGDYMFRYRRYGQLGLVPRTGRVRLLAHTTYFQPKDLNDYAGGLVRDFPPLTREIADSPILQNLVRTSFDVFGVEEEFRDAEWVVDVSLFRVRVEGSRVTEPTPEGIHRDGVPFGVIHAVDRRDIEGGVSHTYTLDKELIDVGVLRDPLDSLYAFDSRVMHYVTPLYAATTRVGWRDVLVYGFSLPETKYQKA